MNLSGLIVDAITAHDAGRPRSQQRTLGPSDLGDPCDHCLAAKLAGWERTRELAWLPYIGTAVHAQLEQAFPMADGWSTEVRTLVGMVGSEVVAGTADLWHAPTRTVIDFKIVGKTTLDQARKGVINEKYRRQLHLYGKGLKAETVAIMYLPRNAPDLRVAVWWEEPYSPGVAEGALARAEGMGVFVRAVGDAGIATLSRAQGCYDCPRYPDWAQYCTDNLAPKPARSIMDGIMS